MPLIANIPSFCPPVFPWRRFWCAWGMPINCGDDGRGFLVDPDGDYGATLNPNVHGVEQIVTENGLLVLCGDPGMGKTNEFKELSRTIRNSDPADRLIALNFREDVSSMEAFRRHTVDSTHWQSWRTGDGRMTLMIDAIDEGLIHIPRFVSLLYGCLKSEPVERLRLILTCRSLEWPESQGSQLANLWAKDARAPDPRYELCPLRYRDVEIAAEVLGQNCERFRDALWKAQAIGLAIRPVTLLMLLAEFRQHGHLPGSHRELYLRSSQRLANEIDPARLEILRSAKGLPQTSSDQRLKAAQRLAALFLCCGRTAMLRDRPDTPVIGNELIVSECSGGNGVPAIAFHDVIESALFTSVGVGFGFSHPTFAECLAAQELASLPLAQVRRVLMQRDAQGEHVVPQLSELAAWTAGTNSAFSEHLLNADPAVLLRCDASVLPAELRAKLVSAILEGVASGRVPDDSSFYRFFHTLNHPGIVMQLRAWVVNKTLNTTARNMAIEMAECCVLKELVDDLIQLMADPSDSSRRAAAEALCKIIPDERLSEIEPLGRGEAGPDGDQSIRGAALKRLVPTRWSVAQALPHIAPRTQRNYIGSYHMFVERELPKHIVIQDLAPCLDWLRDHLGSFDSLSSRNNLAKQVVCLAVRQLDNKEVSDAFVQLWFTLGKNYLLESLATDAGLAELLSQDAAIKRQLTRILLNADPPDDFKDHLLFGEVNLINTAADFAWLLDELPSVPAEHQQVWAGLISDTMLFSPRLIIPSWDKLLQCRDEHLSLTKQLDWLRPLNLDEPVARRAKAAHLCRQRQKQYFKKRQRERHGDVKGARHEALQRAASCKPDAWYDLWQILHWGDEPGHQDHDLKLEVETYQGWKLLTVEEQDTVRDAARLFLTHYVDESSEWEVNSNGSLAATSALWLLRERLGSDGDLHLMGPQWFRLLTIFRDSSESGPSALFRTLYQFDQPAALDALMAATEKYLQKNWHPFSLRTAKLCWDQRCNAAMRALLLRSELQTFVAHGIDGWSEMDREAAATFALEQLTPCLEQAGITYPVTLKGILAQAMLLRPAETFAKAEALLASDGCLSAQVWSEVLSERGVRNEGWLGLWSEKGLASLYLHLIKVLPPNDDPKRDEDDCFIEPRTSAGWARDRIPSEIAARSTRAACDSLWSLIQGLPSQAATLRWYYRNALTQCRRNEWQPLSPSEFMRLLQNAESRLISSEQDLLELVVESLQRLQHHLTGRTNPAVEELWNRLPAKGKQGTLLSPKEEKVLQRAIARWLSDDLGSSKGLVVNCEVEPREGSFTDIWVEAALRQTDGTFEKWTIVIELKGCWHKEVQTAMHHQLVEKYLRPNCLVTGIYLVGWFVCDGANVANRTGCRSLVEAQRWLAAELARYDGTAQRELVAGVVLDCRFPD